MHPINPFLRAFVKSNGPELCRPASNHVIASQESAACILTSSQIFLVPSTDCLLNGRDKDTGLRYADQDISEEFLFSHVLRIDASSDLAESRDEERATRTKRYRTINGRIVVVKESYVYTNKGFRNLAQAHLLHDHLFYSGASDLQPWLIFYISKPLVGRYEAVKLRPAILTQSSNSAKQGNSNSEGEPPARTEDVFPVDHSNIKTFSEVLDRFSIIARDMRAELERLIENTRKDVRDKLYRDNAEDGAHLHRLRLISGDNPPPLTKEVFTGMLLTDGDIDWLRQRVQSTTTQAIDLFRRVDKHMLSCLGTTTTLTIQTAERLLERHVAQQMHETILLPFLCAKEKYADAELESRINRMQDIDITQIGVNVDDWKAARAQLTLRITNAIGEFKKIGDARCPQQMMEVLLATQRLITDSRSSEDGEGTKTSSLNTSADTLVSLLLLVVIRSQVRHLNAGLCYMRNFMFIDDVEAGEMAYALSTYEAVLLYLANDSGGLRKASKKNRMLWRAIQDGTLADVRSILEPPAEIYDSPEEDDLDKHTNGHLSHSVLTNGFANSYSSEASTLAHVFPFQALTPPRKVKRVSMDLRSLSSSSEHSMLSRTTTLDSRTSAIEGDISTTTMSHTQDQHGNSLLMMAVEAKQALVLKYLLSLEDLFDAAFVYDDCNKEGTTLLSAAIQSSDMSLVEPILRCILDRTDINAVRSYLSKADSRGRTAAHYLFNLPLLMSETHSIVPWRAKDKKGQTPLFALCRSYDHPEYPTMVAQAIAFATLQQDDGAKLHLDDHVDLRQNTLLHVIKDPMVLARVLRWCDGDPNAANHRLFTPFMTASKFGRTDLMKVFFGDDRVDLNVEELRQATAVEVAKDDGVRDQIDHMVVLSSVPAANGRVTAIVRSLFVADDDSVRIIIKSAIERDRDKIDVTTCRRSVADFENLAQWLSLEHPASWLPSIFNFRSAFQIPFRPSKALLHDVTPRLDRFLKIMLAHSTFKEHELLWEFYLFPEIRPDMMSERSRMKALARVEMIQDEMEPLTDFHEVLSFVEHARESTGKVSHGTKGVVRRVTDMREGMNNIAVANIHCADIFATLSSLPMSHLVAFQRYAASLAPLGSDPYTAFHYDFQAILSTILAILSSLARPHKLIHSFTEAQKAIERHETSSRRTDRWPLALLEETRKGIQAEAEERAREARREQRRVGCEMRYTQQTVASELAGWQDLHAQLGRRAIRSLAENMILREKCRLDNMCRALRGVVHLRERGRTRKR